MEQYQIKLIETVIIISIVLIFRFLIKKMLLKAKDKFNFQKYRVNFTIKIINGGAFLTAFILILLFWGIDKKDLAFYLSSFVAVLGIALFAQWSMLSNITAGILLFINHPARIGDTIVVEEKDFPIKGKVKDIGLFFISLKTEQNDLLTIPNSLLFQKVIRILPEIKD